MAVRCSSLKQSDNVRKKKANIDTTNPLNASLSLPDAGRITEMAFGLTKPDAAQSDTHLYLVGQCPHRNCSPQRCPLTGVLAGWVCAMRLCQEQNESPHAGRPPKLL